MSSRHSHTAPQAPDPYPIARLDHAQGIEIGGRQCLIVVVDGELEPPMPRQDVDCPPGYRVAGGFRIGERCFALLQPVRNDLADELPDERLASTDLLTERELQIAMLVSRGKVNKQIAFQLHISEYTVSTHLRRIFCKLGVSSRAAMVAQLVRYIPVTSRTVPAWREERAVFPLIEP
jgi:DNA-binding CsgD family transcriptional regulator